MQEYAEWKERESNKIRLCRCMQLGYGASVGEYFYNVAFTFANDKIAIDEEQDFIDGLWHVEGVDVIDEDGEPVDKFEVPSEFPAAATAIDFDVVRKEIGN